MASASWLKLWDRAAANVRRGRGQRCSPRPLTSSTRIDNQARATNRHIATACENVAPRIREGVHDTLAANLGKEPCVKQISGLVALAAMLLAACASTLSFWPRNRGTRDWPNYERALNATR